MLKRSVGYETSRLEASGKSVIRLQDFKVREYEWDTTKMRWLNINKNFLFSTDETFQDICARL